MPLGQENVIFVGIQWDPVASATDHQVRLINDGVEQLVDVPFTVCNPTRNACDYTVTDPAPGDYEFSVRARSDAGESGWSSLVRYHILPAPAAPTIRFEGADIVVSWDGPAETPSWLYYEVCWSVGDDVLDFCPNHVTVNDATEYRFLRPRPGTYRIRFAPGGDWLSPWSDEAVVIIEARAAALVVPPIPRVTSAVSFSPSDYRPSRTPALVTWQPSLGANFYDVKLRVNGDVYTKRVLPNEPLRTDDTDFQINTDSSGDTYYAYWDYRDVQTDDPPREFALRAGNEAGMSDWSDWEIALGVPNRFELQLTDVAAHFQWDAVPGADVYQLCRVFLGGDCDLHEATDATVRLRDLDPGAHDFHVLAGREHEQGGYWWGPPTDVIVVDAPERSVSPRTPPQAPPDTPQNARPTRSIAQPPQNGISIGIKWDVVADADEYEVRWIRDGKEERVVLPREDWEGVNATPQVTSYRDYWLEDPEPGVYDFAVRARNALGNSEWSPTIRHHMRNTPAPPQAVVDGADLVFSWFRPDGATSFDICWMREYGGCFGLSSFARVTEANLRIPNARPGEYQVMLRESGAWTSDWSPWTFITMPDRGLPESAFIDEPDPYRAWRPEPSPLGTLPGPQGLRVRFNGSWLHFEWDALPGAGAYALCRARPEGGCWHTQAPRKTLQGLPAGTHYFRVLGWEFQDDGGFRGGQWSDEVVVEVPEMHGRRLSASAIAIEPVADGVSNSLVTAEWVGVANAERYQVRWRERYPGYTVDHPVAPVRRSLEGERSGYTAQLRTRGPLTLEISLRVDVNGEWSSWTDWLALDPAPRQPSTDD